MTDARSSCALIGYRDKEKELETQGHLHENRDLCRGGRKLNRIVWCTVVLAQAIQGQAWNSC